jgi:hypothetical protein
VGYRDQSPCRRDIISTTFELAYWKCAEELTFLWERKWYNILSNRIITLPRLSCKAQNVLEFSQASFSFNYLHNNQNLLLLRGQSIHIRTHFGEFFDAAYFATRVFSGNSKCCSGWRHGSNVAIARVYMKRLPLWGNRGGNFGELRVLDHDEREISRYPIPMSLRVWVLISPQWHKDRHIVTHSWNGVGCREGKRSRDWTNSRHHFMSFTNSEGTNSTRTYGIQKIWTQNHVPAKVNAVDPLWNLKKSWVND